MSSTIFLNFLLIYVTVLATFLLFLKISGLDFSYKQVILISVAGFLTVLFGAPVVYIVYPSYFVILAICFGNKKSKGLSIFYGLLPVVISDLFRRIITFFILPLVIRNSVTVTDGLFFSYGISLLGILFSWLFFYVFDYDFSLIKDKSVNSLIRRILLPINITMIFYYILAQVLYILDDIGMIETIWFRKVTVAFYLILFFILIAILDRHIKRELQMELLKQKEEQMKSLSQYSSHIEELYKEIRSFRHDYINILTSLRLGIENRDLPGIEKIYHQVLEKTEKQMQNNRYDFGHLMNLKNEALKSVLSAKILEAQNKGIAVGLEIPEIIETFSIEPLDLITIVSIMCDNAIEAAFESSSPEITLALFEQRNALVFIIQNTTKEERIEVNKIFNEGYSTKGQDRGLGLTTVKRILDNYPKANLQTKSYSYEFRHTLII
ncbi:GHKL domain-containing protein [Streptococcus ferus]|uniref:sensor histidine kinase n=1 Tax=Streptococcus ferus TaxID=1345 RepID=UPI0035159CC4